jgi:hypothetical protein
MIGAIRDPKKLQVAASNRQFGIQCPQWNARIVKVIENEFSEVLWIDDVEQFQPIGLPPDDLLFAKRKVRPPESRPQVELAQFYIGSVA